jgi:SAM-dependent methyltransferase
MKEEEIKKLVKEGYGKVASKKHSCCDPESVHSQKNDFTEKISKKIGYTDKDMSSVPEESNLGLGCGNPIALASLEEGDIVLDLGSGAGFDCFLAANKVGRTGKVIGVDMTPEMVEKAQGNAKKGNYHNVEFRLGEIEKLPVEDNSVDVIISNCVVNLSPDKKKVFEESFRVLKPGGSLMVSDIVLLKDLPDSIKNSSHAYINCIAGAVQKNEYIGAIKEAGFSEVKIIDEVSLPFESMGNDPGAKAIIEDLNIPVEKLEGIVNAVVSIKAYGKKVSS